ncbi:MAG: response regulator transcription factor [Flavobacteriales bacterium]|nr:response regulator transcription factor [Flavobacteriales bacterium]
MAELQFSLTERERDILLLIRLGKSNKEIAADLDVSVNTVKTHMRNLFTKLKVNNRTQASHMAEYLVEK